MDKEDKQIINRAIKENWRIGDRSRLKRLLEKNLKLYRENVELEERLTFARAEFQKQYKENEELKKELKDANEKVVHLACYQNKDLKHKLTKAKDIIKNLVEFDASYKDDEEYQYKSELYDKMWEEAEQFLKEETK